MIRSPLCEGGLGTNLEEDHEVRPVPLRISQVGSLSCPPKTGQGNKV